MIWEIGEFEELLICQKLLVIELYRWHFWRLCFFEVFGGEIHFFDQHFFFANFASKLRFLGFQINMDLAADFDEMGKR